MAEQQKFDISVEAYREYVYSNGGVFKIATPATLYIMPNGSHRVVDQAGVTHRPERGYVGIRWVQVDGKPFEF